MEVKRVATRVTEMICSRAQEEVTSIRFQLKGDAGEKHSVNGVGLENVLLAGIGVFDRLEPDV